MHYDSPARKRSAFFGQIGLWSGISDKTQGDLAGGVILGLVDWHLDPSASATTAIAFGYSLSSIALGYYCDRKPCVEYPDINCRRRTIDDAVWIIILVT